MTLHRGSFLLLLGFTTLALSACAGSRLEPPKSDASTPPQQSGTNSSQPQPATASNGATRQGNPSPVGTQPASGTAVDPAVRAKVRAAAKNYVEGDAAFLARKDPAKAQRALELFRKYHSENPNDAEAAWRHSMGCYFAGLHLMQSDDQRKEVYAEGRDAGLQSIHLAPKCAPCQFWTAINMSLYGQTVGVFKMVFSLSEIRDHLQASAAADPTYAGAGAYRLLGLIEQKLPGILGGSDKKAREYFERAMQTDPNEPLNHLFMVKLLVEKFDDIPAAREVAKRGLQVPPPPADRIESVGSLKELQDFLAAHQSQ